MKNTITTISFFSLLLSYFIFGSNSSGAIPAVTGAPAEQTCGIPSCHNTMANQAGASASINFDTNQTSFEFGLSYPVQIRLDNALNPKNGFEIVALDNNNNSVGSWSSLGADIQEKSGTNGRSYLTQTLGGSSQNVWDFQWDAPSSNASEVTFYLAALDANGNGNKNGDDLYTLSKTIMGPVSNTNETTMDQKFFLSPNPVKNELRVISQDKKNKVKSLALIDSQGKRLITLKEVNQLDLGSFNTGLYYIIIEDQSGNRTTKKILKI